MLISESYRELNRRLHASNELYGGELKPNTTEMLTKVCQQLQTSDLLDYGCGKGVIASALPFPPKEYDPAIKGKEASPEPADVVYCGDVLEHIEPECLNDVLDDLVRVTKKIGIFVIHLTPALKFLEDGRNTHLILESGWWWADKLSKKFLLKGVMFFDSNRAVQIVVAPKV